MKTKTLFVLLFCITLGACSSTKFTRWEGNKSFKGEGGAKEVVEGIEIWTTGTPPRVYKIIGVINDRRNTGRFYMVLGQMKDLALAAAENGGDAIIILERY